MGLREYRDAIREQWVTSDTAPTRAITYVRNSDSLSIPLNVFVSGEEFNKDLPDEKKVTATTFSGVKLSQEPTKLDTIIFLGRTYSVREWQRLGTLYTILADTEKRNRSTSRKFK